MKLVDFLQETPDPTVRQKNIDDEVVVDLRNDAIANYNRSPDHSKAYKAIKALQIDDVLNKFIDTQIRRWVINNSQKDQFQVTQDKGKYIFVDPRGSVFEIMHRAADELLDAVRDNQIKPAVKDERLIDYVFQIFGRDPNQELTMRESLSETTTAGGIAAVITPLGGVQRRNPVIGRGVYEYANSVKKRKPKKLRENEEYRDEAGMAKTNLHTAMRAVRNLHNTIADGEDLPEWVQEKIAVVKRELVTISDYMLSQHEQGIQPMAEEKNMREIRNVKR